jgi:hypothetical protein
MPDLNVSEDADRYITDIDSKIAGKHNVTLRELLANPQAYKDSADAKALKSEVDAYFSELIKAHEKDVAELDEGLKRATEMYNRVDKKVAEFSEIMGLVYITPVMVSREEEKDERIIIEPSSSYIDRLVESIAKDSVYVANLSVGYKDFILGEWLFSGKKNIVIEISKPSNAALPIQLGMAEITEMLDRA